MNKKFKARAICWLACCLISALASSNAVSDTIYFEDFSGAGGQHTLTDSLEDFAGATWVANGFATDDGNLYVGQAEGSATLPFTPSIGTVYTLSLEVTTASDRWFGIGFAENASTGDFNRPQDRFAQSGTNQIGGVSWFLLRPGTSNTAQQVEIFGGPGTDNVIPDDGTDFSGPAVTRTMQVILDAAADPTGNTFEANFLIDGVSVSSGFQVVDVPVASITTVGFTFEGPDGSGTGPAIVVDNFMLEDDSVSGSSVPPDSFSVFRGITVSAMLSDFTSSDDQTGQFNPGFTINNTEAPVWLIFDGNASAATEFFVESQAGTPGLTLTIEAFAWATSSYDELGSLDETFNTDSVFAVPVTAADHVDSDGSVRGRVGWRQTGFTINFPWEVRVDNVGWNQ